jgi:3-oxoadipate enol-lactonase
MDWVETNGVVLPYERSGTGPVPLPLIHELGGSLEFWDPVLPAFQQDFQALRYDLRGFGMSEKVKTLRLDALLDHLSPGRYASTGSDDPLTRVSTPTMIRAVRCVEELAQDPRTATVRHPRGETA